MTERMNRERMVETRLHKCILEDDTYITRLDRLRFYASSMTLEYEIVTGEALLVDAQQDKQLG
jgi:hypothetical protein